MSFSRTFWILLARMDIRPGQANIFENLAKNTKKMVLGRCSSGLSALNYLVGLFKGLGRHSFQYLDGKHFPHGA